MKSIFIVLAICAAAVCAQVDNSYLPPEVASRVDNTYLPPAEQAVAPIENEPTIDVKSSEPEEEEVVAGAAGAVGVVAGAGAAAADDTEEIVAASVEPEPAHELAEDGYRYKTVKRIRYRYRH